MSRALTLVCVGIVWPLAFVLAERYAGRILRSRRENMKPAAAGNGGAK